MGNQNDPPSDQNEEDNLSDLEADFVPPQESNETPIAITNTEPEKIENSLSETDLKTKLNFDSFKVTFSTKFF